ncbi:hypothetical protein MARGE09_P0599 [Marinagarivorans cellulosilyticus]|uniref:Solute-binding protein family 3/N-terminal domain-containing protein n=2 Tax=Marinagarivorans cellulosilyticus TaxID=2721545 RepID=A0AAN1WF18_9GAMM|nr:hypothetical protein MARGE09_P0599 [Marinagarivorans cellulosilyticus]
MRTRTLPDWREIHLYRTRIHRHDRTVFVYTYYNKVMIINPLAFICTFNVYTTLVRFKCIAASLTCLLVSPYNTAIAGTPTTAATPTTEITLYNLSFTPSIQKILQTTIERSLELTRDEYGDYVLNHYPVKTSDERIKRMIDHGTRIHLYFSTQHALPAKQRKISNIEIPFLSSVLGLRVLLTKEQDIEQFNDIRTLDNLREFNAGIGHNWAEKKIFKAQNIPYKEGLLANNLLPMLEKKRFDYIALSVLDDPAALGNSQDMKITTLDDLMLYYPIPIQLNTSSAIPELATRLKKGLERFTENGEANALIKSIFSDADILQNSKKIRLITIENPLYNQDENNRAFKDLLEQFPQKFIMIKSD